MSVIEKVLLRKDMAAVAVAIVVGFATVGLLSSLTSPIAGSILDSYQGSDTSFKDTYLLPIFIFVLQVLALEGLLRLVILGRAYNTSRTK